MRFHEATNTIKLNSWNIYLQINENQGLFFFAESHTSVANTRHNFHHAKSSITALSELEH